MEGCELELEDIISSIMVDLPCPGCLLRPSLVSDSRNLRVVLDGVKKSTAA
jgi:hypothetical protein